MPFRVWASVMAPASRCPGCHARKRSMYGGDWARLARAAIAAHPWCVDCGATTDLTADHVRAGSLSQGVAVRCRSCNSRKGDRSP